MAGIEFAIHHYGWTRSRRYVSAVLVVAWLLACFVPRHALAQSGADRATARNLAAEGYTALKTQDYATAEDRFRRADALVHAPTLVVDHARALMGLGRYVEAEERLELVIREGVADNAPWVWKKAIQDAEKLVNEAKPKVAWLTINVNGPNVPSVTVDGKEVPVAALGVRRAVDPGERRISATASGYLQTEISVTMPEGGERAVSLDMSVDPAAVASPTGSAPQRQPTSPRRSAPPKKPDNTLAFAALGVGGVGLVVGTVTGMIALGKRSDLTGSKYSCSGSHCPEAARSTVDAYHRYGIMSGVGFGVGVASSAIGVWLLLSNSTTESGKASARASVRPYVSVGDVGIVGAF
jgi:hypothetical protein